MHWGIHQAWLLSIVKTKQMIIILATATSHEIAPALHWLEREFELVQGGGFELYEKIELYPLVTGVGMLSTAYSLMRRIKQLHPDLIIQAGLGGALNRKLSPGDVVHVTSEQIADLGAEDADGSFLSVFDLDLTDPDEPPFDGGVMYQPEDSNINFLPEAKGFTVNKVHGSKPSIERLKERIDADVESQEGAALFYTGIMEDTSFLELRAISNYVEPRNRSGWTIDTALDALNECLKEMIPLFIPE